MGFLILCASRVQRLVPAFEVNMVEVWKDVVGYEGLYSISNYGKVKNKKRNNIRKLRLNTDGYFDVCLHKKGIPKMHLVHRLVAAAFIGLSIKPINHKDGDKLHNSVLNIEYCTAKENMNHAARTGLLLVGEKHHLTKLSSHTVIDIRKRFLTGVNKSQLAKKHKVSWITINRIINKTSRIYA